MATVQFAGAVLQAAHPLWRKSTPRGRSTCNACRMAKKSDDLRGQVLEIAEIAKACPEAFQERCFELLLQDLLSHRRTAAPVREQVPDAPDDLGSKNADQALPEDPRPPVDTSTDLSESDLHVKAKNFMKKQGLSIDDINQLFYREDGDVLPLFDDLKTTKMSESQIRIALMQALRTGLESGAFEFDGEEVRAECQLRKAYDPSNFTANFKNNAELFESFEKYDKASPTIRLSEVGKSRLADLARELI